MTDIEMLHKIDGAIRVGKNIHGAMIQEIKPCVVDELRAHLKPDEKTVRVKDLEERIAILEKIIVSKGYQIDEQLGDA